MLFSISKTFFTHNFQPPNDRSGLSVALPTRCNSLRPQLLSSSSTKLPQFELQSFPQDTHNDYIAEPKYLKCFLLDLVFLWVSIAIQSRLFTDTLTGTGRWKDCGDAFLRRTAGAEATVRNARSRSRKACAAGPLLDLDRGFVRRLLILGRRDKNLRHRTGNDQPVMSARHAAHRRSLGTGAMSLVCRKA